MLKFEDNSKEAKAAIRNALEQGLMASSELVKSQAKAIVPVDTGALRKSIDSDVNKSQLSAKVGANTDYAEKIEFTQPYIRPAFRNSKEKAENLFQGYLNKI